MGRTDDEFDAASRRLLDEIAELRQLELLKRETPPGSKQFQDLASKVDDAARHVFDTAGSQLIDGEDDGALQAERDELHPDNRTEGSRRDLQ